MKIEKLCELLESLAGYYVSLSQNDENPILEGELSIIKEGFDNEDDDKVILINIKDYPLVIFNKESLEFEGEEGMYVTIVEGDFRLNIVNIALNN